MLLGDQFVISTEEELVNVLTKLGKNEVSVTFGVRPSGEIHVGHLVVFVNALHSIKKVCDQLGLKVRCYIKIVDLDSLKDFDYCLQPINHWGEVFKYSEPKTSSYSAAIKSIFEKISNEISIEFKILLESEIYQLQEFRTKIMSWIEAGIIGEFPEKIQIYGICPECSRFSCISLRGEKFAFKCLNNRCQAYSKLDKDFNIADHEICFNHIDRPIIKDIFWNIDMHIIGGDHLRKRPKISRMDILSSRSIEFFGKFPCHYSTGKVVLGFDGEKMSKSRGNTVLARSFISENQDWYSKLISSNSW